MLHRTARLAIAAALTLNLGAAVMTTPASADNNSALAEVSVLWVGHSLIEQKIETDSGTIDLMRLVGAMAAEQGLSYRHGDHTLWGSPLSALWRGQPHQYERDAGKMVAKREAFESDPGRFDTIVLTEALPLRNNLKGEYSAYYVRRFACALTSANPKARILLYQTWANLQPGKQWRSYRDWRRDMAMERAAWVNLSKSAAAPGVPAPHWLARFGLGPTSDGGCKTALNIEMVPVGDVFVALSELDGPSSKADLPPPPDGKPFTLADLFSNPVAPPANGTANAGTGRPSMPRDPSRDHDDIHLSAEGVYVAALTHFAVLYRRSPVGLQVWPSLGPALSKALQEIVWRTVKED